MPEISDTAVEAVKTLLRTDYVPEIEVNLARITRWGHDEWLVQMCYGSCDTYADDQLDEAVRAFLGHVQSRAEPRMEPRVEPRSRNVSG